MDYMQYYESYLGPHGHLSGNNCSFQCPMCDVGSHDHHMFVNIVTSVYHCFRCGAKGNSATFAKFMGDSVPKDIKAGVPEKELYDHPTACNVFTYLMHTMKLDPQDMEELTTKRGILHPARFGLRTLLNAVQELKRQFTSEQLILSGLFYEKEGYVVPRSVLNDGRLLIPYIQENKVVFMRTRGNEGVKYLCPKFAKTTQNVWGKLMPNKTTVLITEGEFKAMSAASHGANILALPGMNSSHEALVEILRDTPIKKLIVCFDSQIKAMNEVDRAANRLSRLIKRELPSLVVARATLPLLPEIDGGQKMDIDSFIANIGWSEFQRLIRKESKLWVG